MESLKESFYLPMFLQSGSIMAVLGYVCMQFPETQLGIILLPFFTFSAGTVSENSQLLVFILIVMIKDLESMYLISGNQIYCWT